MIVFYKWIRFKQLNGNPNIFIQQCETEINIISVYVDDFCISSNTMTILNEIKVFLLREYDVKNLKEVKTIIG